MAIFTQRISCYRRRTQSYHKGYIDPFDEEFQIFMIVRKILGIVVSKTVIFEEEIPQHVLIELGAFGSSDWRSAAPQWLHDECKKKDWSPKWSSVAGFKKRLDVN